MTASRPPPALMPLPCQGFFQLAVAGRIGERGELCAEFPGRPASAIEVAAAGDRGDIEGALGSRSMISAVDLPIEPVAPKMTTRAAPTVMGGSRFRSCSLKIPGSLSVFYIQ